MIIQKINDTGIALYGALGEHIKSLKAYVESSSVQIWVEIGDREYMQYLTPAEAMALSRALDRLAVQALRAGGDSTP